MHTPEMRDGAPPATGMDATTARQGCNLATANNICVDDLRDGYGIGDPDHCNRWGALFAAAHRAGLIRPTGGIAVSRRRSRASGTAREWVGVSTDPRARGEAA